MCACVRARVCGERVRVSVGVFARVCGCARVCGSVRAYPWVRARVGGTLGSHWLAGAAEEFYDFKFK